MTIDDKCVGCSPSAATDNARAATPFGPSDKGAFMRNMAVWAAFIVACGSIGLAQGGAQAPAGGGGRGPGAEGRTVILEQAPKDHSIAIPKDKLAQYLKDMDAKKLQTLRMIEGGKYNVNIRRITAAGNGAGAPDHRGPVGGARRRRNADNRRRAREGQDPRRPEPADQSGRRRLHPFGAAARRERRGQQHHVAQRAMGHGLAADAPMGAGTVNGLLGRAAGARAGGRVRARGRRCRPEASRSLPYSYGGSGELFFSKEQLDQIMAGMRLKKSVNTRLIEGGRYNVNLRWNGTPTVELHEQTIDTWYVLAGGATVNTGYQVKDGERVPNTGVSVVTKPGDVFFHPSNFYHGFSEVTPDIFWLNIRWDDNYAPKQ